jgi:hypothetical protein
MAQRKTDHTGSKIVKTGGDYFTLKEIRTMLYEANNAFDGSGPVALILVKGEKRNLPKLECVETPGAAVVNLPGDGRPFPERAFAEALRVAPVIVERE